MALADEEGNADAVTQICQAAELPGEGRAVTHEYREYSDLRGELICEEYVVGAGARIKSNNLYSRTHLLAKLEVESRTAARRRGLA